MERVWLKHYPQEIPHFLDCPSLSLPQILENSAQKFPFHPAIIFWGRKISYRELSLLTHKFSLALFHLGLRKGERVGIVLPNCPQAVIGFYAILKLGGIGVMANPLYVERELEYQFKDAGIETLIVLDLLYPKIEKIKEKIGIKKIIIVSLGEYLPFPFRLLYYLRKKIKGKGIKIKRRQGIYLFRDLIKGSFADLPPIEISPDDLALIQYTGGTTGLPKGVMLTHRNLVANVVQCRYWFFQAEEGKEAMLGILPLFHAFGITVCMNFPLYLGATTILLPRFEVKRLLKIINRDKPTLFPGVPTIYVAIIQYPHLKRYDLSSIKFCFSGAAPLPSEVLEKFEKLTGGKILEGYGLTEASPIALATPLWGERKVGSVGIPFPGTDCKIMDLEEEGKELPPGEIGELWVKGPQVMKGYWKLSEETAQVLKEGWLKTGDIARMDKDGYFYLLDRKKEIILSKGFTIYPNEIDQVLQSHPLVEEAVSFGLPDLYQGERVKAVVVLKEERVLKEEELLEFCRKNLAPYKLPAQIEFRKALPKNPMGKVLRRTLKEEEEKKLKEVKGD